MTSITITPSSSGGPVALPVNRGCRCEQPWRDEDSCLRCGRAVPPAVQRGPRRRRSHADGNPWTVAGVVRALRTYRFFLGRVPSRTDWSFEDDKEWPSVRTVVTLFGSFDAAVDAACATATRSST
jgi:hypothetical protein